MICGAGGGGKTPLRKALRTNLVNFDVHFDLSSLLFFFSIFLEVDFKNLIFIWSFLTGFFQSPPFDWLFSKPTF